MSSRPEREVLEPAPPAGGAGPSGSRPRGAQAQAEPLAQPPAGAGASGSRRRAVARAVAAPAAAPGAAAPAGGQRAGGAAAAGDDEALWREFDEARERQLARYDRLGGILYMAIEAAAAWRLRGVSGQVMQPHELVYTAILNSTVLAVVVAAGSDEYTPKRRALLAVLRIAASWSPVLQGKQDDVSDLTGMVRALARIMYGDHCTLLAFLALAWPLDGLLALAVQVVSLALVIPQNARLCTSPYMRSLQSTQGLGALHSRLQALAHMLPVPIHRTFYTLGSHQICELYTTSLQILTGWLAPILFHLCDGTRQTLRFARERGVSDANPRLRRARAVDRLLCTRTPVPLRMLALLPVVAGMVLLLTNAATPEF